MGSSPSLQDKACAKGTMSLREVLLASNLLVVDVRGEEEAKTGFFPGSKNIPISEFDQRVKELGEDMKAPIVIHCRGGVRASTCRDIAVNQGYVNVFSLDNASHVKQLQKEALA